MLDNIDFDVEGDSCPSISWDKQYADNVYIENTEKLISFVESYGYSVELEWGCYTRIDHRNMTIYLNSMYGPKRVYYSLLHEIGHMVLNVDLQKPDGDCFPYLMHYAGLANRNMKRQRKNSNRYMVSLVHEELDASRKGIDIAHVLGLELDMYDYTNYCYQAAGTYIKAAEKYCKDFI